MVSFEQTDGRSDARAAADPLGAAAARRRRRRQHLGAVRRARRRRQLAGRAPRRLGRVVGRALGAGRRRRGRGRREPGRDAARASSRRSGASQPERLQVEALVRLRSGMVMLVGQAWLPTARASRPTRSTTSSPGGRPTVERWPAEADAPLRSDRRSLLSTRLSSPTREPAGGQPMFTRVVTFRRLEIVSLLPLVRLSGAAGLRFRARQPRAGDLHPRARPTVCCGSGCRLSASPRRAGVLSLSGWP